MNKVHISKMKYTIKGKSNKGSLTTSIEASTKEEARTLYLKENPEYSNILYIRESGRYSYSTVGYGIFSLMGYFYASGRIEIYDDEDESEYAIDEGSYWVPLKDEWKVRDFFDDLETTDPLYIRVGSFEDCQKAVSDKVGVEVDKLNDKEEVKKFSKKRYQEYLNGLDDEERKRLEETYGN